MDFSRFSAKARVPCGWIGALLLCAGLPVLAQDAGFASLQEVPQIPSSVATITTPQGVARLALRNEGRTPMQVFVEPMFRHDHSGAAIAAVWQVFPGGAAVQPGTALMVLPGALVTLEARATLPGAGSYEILVEAVQPDTGQSQRFLLRLARTTEPVPATFLLEPKTVPVELSLTETLVPGLAHPVRFVRLVGRNAGAQTLALEPPRVGPVLRTDGSAFYAVPQFQGMAPIPGVMPSIHAPKPAKRPEPSVYDCGAAVLPGADCGFDLALPAGLGPGRYSVDVMVPGTQGGQSLRAVPITVRGSLWLAAVLVAAGAVLGALVTDWRGAGRSVIDRRIALADLARDVQAVHAAARTPQVRRAALLLRLDLRRMDVAAIGSSDAAAETLRLADLRARCAALVQASALLQVLGTLEPVARGLFLPLEQRLLAVLDAPDWNAALIGATLAQVQSELAGLPGLIDAVLALEAAMAPFGWGGGLIARGGDPGAALWQAAQAARATAFAPLAPPADGGADGATGTRGAALLALADGFAAGEEGLFAALMAGMALRLDATAAAPEVTRLAADLGALAGQTGGLGGRLAQARALWVRVLALPGNEAASPVAAAAVAETTGTQGALLAASSALTFGFSADVFQPPSGASGRSLREARSRWNLATNAIVLAGIAAAGVLALWASNVVWGSAQDMITAVFAGAGTRMSIGALGAAKAGAPSAG